MFEELPELAGDYKDKASQFKGYFSGDPEKVLIDLAKEGEGSPEEKAQQVQPEEELDSDEEAEKEKKVLRSFKEIDRLSYVVRAIEDNCQMIPVGVVRLTTQHEIIRNAHFEGLSKECAQGLSNYMHFRACQSVSAKNKVNMPDSILQFNFLELLTDDYPRGLWSVHTDFSGENVTIRNLEWPGYLGYHQAGTPLYGGVYIGDGTKNADLAFMI